MRSWSFTATLRGFASTASLLRTFHVALVVAADLTCRGPACRPRSPAVDQEFRHRAIVAPPGSRGRSRPNATSSSTQPIGIRCRGCSRRSRSCSRSTTSVRRWRRRSRTPSRPSFPSGKLVVDDGSSDGTLEILPQHRWSENVTVVEHDWNRGKAPRSGPRSRTPRATSPRSSTLIPNTAPQISRTCRAPARGRSPRWCCSRMSGSTRHRLRTGHGRGRGQEAHRTGRATGAPDVVPARVR